MAMTVMNNPSAMLTLGQLNKNISKAGKDLKKVASGMKINGAGDDASGYSISEKMRVQIRSLGQDEQNVQNGKSLLKVAAGGIDNIVDELRNLKELAINAANDTNTDEDRATMQKEFDNRRENINDIASTTNYNGRLLLNGDYWRPSEYWGVTHQAGVPYQKTVQQGYVLVPQTILVDKKVSTGLVEVKPNSVSGLASAFTSANDITQDKGSGTNTDSSRKGAITLDYSKSFVGNPVDYVSPGTYQRRHSGNPDSDIAVKMDFSGMSATNIPNDLNQEGFSILCSGCSQFITIRFDASTSSSTYQTLRGSNVGSVYTIGIQNVTNLSELEDAVFDGIKNAPGKPIGNGGYYNNAPDTSDNVMLDSNHDVRIAKSPDGNGYVFLKNNDGLELQFYDKGTVEDVYTVQQVPQTVNVPMPNMVTMTVTPINDEHGWIYEPGNPLVIHHGPKANQALNVYINDMHSDAMELDDVAVTTRYKANFAISSIDAALDYALDEATYVGSYISRLDFTEANIVTANENTQASESTIRDADMAKEMTEYTKSNVLAQASQSMLAQANQNSSSVLSLLQ